MLSVIERGRRTTSILMQALRIEMPPSVGETRAPAEPLIASDDEWLVIHDPKHSPIRMDVHCPQCVVYNCGWCQYCEDDYFQCCTSTCASGACACL